MTATHDSATSSGSWKLASGVASDTQALVVAGFSNLPAALALYLHVERHGEPWLKALLDVAPVTAADGPHTPTIAFGLTYSGLCLIGAEEIAKDLSPPFVAGMLEENRRRRLGDATKEGAPLPTIRWAGNQQAGGQALDIVHALLLLYHTDHDALRALADTVEGKLTPFGVQVKRRQHLDLRPDDASLPREHFGFADGISQPIPFGEGTSDGDGRTFEEDPIHGVPLGEILLGYPDAHRRRASGPLIVGTETPDGFVPLALSEQRAKAQVDIDQQAPTTFDFGRNGSYLVVRELQQDVAGFWASMKDIVDDLNARYPDRPKVDDRWIAERVVGRTQTGDVLRPSGALPPVDDGPDNDFLFFVEDQMGRGCPLGSHVRRANPRDGLAFKADAAADILKSANAHRILRRGRKFGGDVAGSSDPPGLLFMCLNTDIARQFEFVQQNWMLNPSFATLFDEVDPLVGPSSPMTLPDQPMSRRVKVGTYVTLLGGDYFFLPSLRALRVLAALR